MVSGHDLLLLLMHVIFAMFLPVVRYVAAKKRTPSIDSVPSKRGTYNPSSTLRTFNPVTATFTTQKLEEEKRQQEIQTQRSRLEKKIVRQAKIRK